MKAKLALEEMEIGQTLELIVDQGIPADYVPKTLAADGQEILEQGPLDERYRIMVRKAVD